MPYIKWRDRERLEENDFTGIRGPGELNYCLSKLMIDYWENSEKDYQAINDIVGAVEGAKLEFIRRKVNPYEDLKIFSNGDIY